MKKIFAILAIAGTLSACGGGDTDKPATGDSGTKATVNNAVNTADSANKMMDKAKDSANNMMNKVGDSASKMMDKAADKMKDAGNKMVDKAKEAVKH